jgi:hypothetical protein
MLKGELTTTQQTNKKMKTLVTDTLDIINWSWFGVLTKLANDNRR